MGMLLVSCLDIDLLGILLRASSSSFTKASPFFSVHTACGRFYTLLPGSILESYIPSAS